MFPEKVAARVIAKKNIEHVSNGTERHIYRWYGQVRLKKLWFIPWWTTVTPGYCAADGAKNAAKVWVQTRRIQETPHELEFKPKDADKVKSEVFWL